MLITQIVHFGREPSSDGQTTRAAINDTILKAAKALEGAKQPQQFVLGTRLHEENAIQIMSEWNAVHDFADFKATAEFGSFMGSMRNSFGEPQSIFHVALDRSAFGRDGPATANVVEFVLCYFPASRTTPEFQKQIEEDFFRFDDIFKKDARGNGTLTLGWVLEEQEHENIKGEKAKCFFVARGWETMRHFEESVKTDAYKEAIPLLFAWNTPFKMV
ncbi:hypothetical protein CC78DRAFT_535571, partial [Lojkania enalia]